MCFPIQVLLLLKARTLEKMSIFFPSTPEWNEKKLELVEDAKLMSKFQLELLFDVHLLNRAQNSKTLTLRQHLNKRLSKVL